MTPPPASDKMDMAHKSTLQNTESTFILDMQLSDNFSAMFWISTLIKT